MKIKPSAKAKKLKQELQSRQEESEAIKKRRNRGNTLPSDEYTPLFEPTRFLVRETASSSDPTKFVKQYIEISVKRFGGDEVNDPMVYIQMYQESEKYTGYLRGKTVYFPIEMLYEFIDQVTEVSETCDKLGI